MEQQPGSTVRCKRCGHNCMIDLTEVIWPREKQVHTLVTALRCQRCTDGRREGAAGAGGAAQTAGTERSGASQEINAMLDGLTKREIVAACIGISVACALTLVATVYVVNTYILDRSNDPLSTVRSNAQPKK